MAKEVEQVVENYVDDNSCDYELMYQELLSRVNKLYDRFNENYEFYKGIYIEHVNNNNATIKQESNYQLSKKVLDDFKFYLNKYIMEKVESKELVF